LSGAKDQEGNCNLYKESDFSLLISLNVVVFMNFIAAGDNAANVVILVVFIIRQECVIIIVTKVDILIVTNVRNFFTTLCFIIGIFKRDEFGLL